MIPQVTGARRFSRRSKTAFIGVGSNVGERVLHIQKALRLIREIPETYIVQISDWGEFEARGVSPAQEPYLNGVLRLVTELPPLDLLEKLQAIERRLGRTTKGDLAPRTVDLDILSYGNDVFIRGKRLVIPHPRLHERRFVLEGLAQIEPEWAHPRLKKTARELLDALKGANQFVADERG